ncbi:MAG: patatin-like phospholipase family protein [Hydrogenoanaerobacterium sp.]
MGKTALVLAGGGSRGSYELGVWQALREMDITIDMVTGTSIGAINGSMIAQGDYDTAVALWDKLETSHVFDVEIDESQSIKAKVLKTYKTFLNNFIKSGGTDSNPLKKTLCEYFDEEKIRLSPIDYGIVTVEMDTHKPHEVFKDDIPQGKIIDYILASASIYPAIKPYIIDGVRYIDGAYCDNLPVRMALEKGATSIIAVDLEAFGVVKKEELKLAQHVKYIKCHWDLGPTLVFDHATMHHNIRLGYLDALKAYGAYEGQAYTFINGFTATQAQRFKAEDYIEKFFTAAKNSMLDKMFLSLITKFLQERGVTEFNEENISLLCAEVAGKTFGISSENIYSEEVWLKNLAKAVQNAEVPPSLTANGLSENKTGVFEILKNTGALLDKCVRTKYAALVIKDILLNKRNTLQLPAPAFLPDAFLGGLYLALYKLV